MFSGICNIAGNVCEKFKIEDALADSYQSARQLQSELLDAVGQGMVTTRRQSHGLQSEELRDGSEIDTLRQTSKKRGTENSGDTTPLVPPSKRRKGRPAGSGTSTPGLSETQGFLLEDDTPEKEMEVSTQENDILLIDVQKSTPKQSSSPHAAVAASNKVHDFPRERSGTVTPVHRRVGARQEHPQAASVSSANSGKNDGKAIDISTAPRSTHFRFGSEELDLGLHKVDKGRILADARSVTTVAGPEDVDDEDDDDAPEVVLASTGAETARARTLEAEKAATRQRLAARKKRRERDVLLKKQAQSTTKSRKGKTMNISENSLELHNVVPSANTPPSPAPGHGNPAVLKTALPALLPDEILAAEPVPRLPTPPLSLKLPEKSKPKKRTFIDTNAKPPKDLMHGPVRVHVLEAHRQTLPPKASKESRNIKESWLSGRRGRNGTPLIQRRKVGLAFARK